MRKITSLLSLLFMMMGGVSLWAQLPQGLELTTDINAPVYYHIKSVRTNNNQNVYLRYNGDHVGITRVATLQAAGPEGFWFFMKGSQDNTVKIYAFHKKAMADVNSFNETGIDWYVKKNQYVDSAVTISITENVATGNHCLDANNSNNGVGKWNSTKDDHEGTAWQFVKVEGELDFTQDIKDLLTRVNSTLINQGLTDTTYVGYFNAAKLAELEQIKKEAEGKKTLQDFYEINFRLKVLLDPNFEAGAYYVIENQNSGNKKYPSTQHMHSKKDGVYGVEDNNDRVVRRVTAEASLLPRLWKFEKQNGGGYKIRNANTACVWSSYVANGIDMPINKDAGGVYSVEVLPSNLISGGLQSFNTKFLLKISGHMINAFQGDNNSVLCDYDGNHVGDRGNWWSFKKVTTIPVTIGTTGWASMALPFAVSLPEGVTAYIATACKNDVLTLSEVKGIIPANTGFLLTGAANTYNLTIATGEAASVEGNLLKGATCKRLGFAEGETFGLGVSGDKAVFMKNALKDEAKGNKGYVPANKAYILTTDLVPASQAASMLQFNFGGEATGIDGVVADDAKETIYYDLNGRRVLYPTQGVYVTNTGKKVFIR